MIKRIIVVFLIAGILIVSSVTSAAGTDALVKVVPASIDASVGDEFTVEVVVDPAGADVYGVQYDLVFDPAVLQVVNQTAGDFLSQDGANTIEVVNRFNNTAGKLEYGETRMGVEGGVTDPGVLTRITFRVVGDHGSNLKLEDVIVSNPEAQPLDISVEDGVCLVGGNTPGATLTATQTGGTSIPIPTVTVTGTATTVVTATTTPPATSTTPEKTGTPVATPVHTEEPESTPAATTTPNTPGFGLVIAGIGIMMIAYAFKRRI
ncbi:MAG: membrane protein containing Cellulosome anchoring protein, cohesin region domain protein [Candidatus Syntrophoarchaeum caldarius]|uniref:Membrane protein containing Cellulosome anchoring protein, cohesin region domain protein n=1 Tax=Candidatus Syntropharchaeum caldarium TaxID=1838285 RepID=A0A1F2PAS1_9EURY|nr:MAG: membrane protein containing Cellulosome anchoring protein, cohesin region domain protein [Candidatus Syntrophoarchaeum caldarius]